MTQNPHAEGRRGIPMRPTVIGQARCGPSEIEEEALSINTIRSAGIGLAVYGLGTAIAFMGSGSPGGDYTGSLVTNYTAPSHFIPAFALWYIGALSAVGLVVFAAGIRRLAEAGPVLAGLAVMGAAVSLTGSFVSGGLEVAMAEGGPDVRGSVPGPVVYTITEIGNLLAVCAPALCIGVAALLLAARGRLPRWLRAFSVFAGVCGILAPLFFTYFVFVLWTVVAGLTLARSAREPAPLAEPHPSLV